MVHVDPTKVNPLLQMHRDPFQKLFAPHVTELWQFPLTRTCP
jgi:hypothetical protein